MEGGGAESQYVATGAVEPVERAVERARIDELVRGERIMQVTRWVAVVFAVVQVSTYSTAPYPPGYQRIGYVLAGILGVANVALTAVGRRVDSLLTARVVAGAGLAVDLAVASGFVWLYTFDDTSALWAVLFVIPLEGAARFALPGALASWAAVTGVYTAREVWGSANYGYELQPESISFRMGIGLLVALVAGLLARELVDQRHAADAASRRYEKLVAGLDAVIYERDPQTLAFTFVSDAAVRLMGYPREAWMASPDFWREHVHPDDLERVLDRLSYLLAGGSEDEVEYRFVCADGHVVWLSSRSNVERDERGAAVQVRGVLVDITERKQAEAALRESEQRFRTAFNGAGTGMALVGIDGRFLRVNDELVRITGYSEDELLASSLIAVAHPDDQGVARALIRRILTGDQRTFSLELRCLHKSGTAVWSTLNASMVSDDQGRPVYLIAQVQDISERKRAEELLEHQALHDPLTGLPNRTLLVDRLEHAIVRSRRTEKHAAVLFLDLDRFKLVNDSLGHDAGDQLLVAVARRVQSVLRPQDTAARFGGDEFVVVCEDVASPDDAARIADRIAEVLAAPFALPDGETFLTASVGIAVSRSDDVTADSLLRDADAAMYRAKERGKARYEIFDDVLRERAQSRLRMVNALHRALDRDEFRLLYQPIVDLRTGEYVAVEALLRWQQGRALVPPGEFMALAEETGLMVRIGAWAAGEAGRQVQEWGRAGQRVTVSVNLSARELAMGEAVRLIGEAIDDGALDPGGLRVEVAETMLADAGATRKAVEALRSLGVAVYVDDFGTGYSSLTTLKGLAVDGIKIDGSVVRGVGRDPEDTAIAAAMVSVAKALGMRTVAEGVETGEQLRHLLSLGCEEAQGYYFSAPQDPETVARLLRSGRAPHVEPAADPATGAADGPAGGAAERGHDLP